MKVEVYIEISYFSDSDLIFAWGQVLDGFVVGLQDTTLSFHSGSSVKGWTAIPTPMQPQS